MPVDSKLPSEADEMLSKAAARLRESLETGSDWCVETILSAFPALSADSLRAVELIVLEFELRRQKGESPDPEQWCQHFPQWRAELRQRLQRSAFPDAESNGQETAALQTAPYAGNDRPTVVDIEIGVPVLGRHEILEEIGRGGMGVVYQARDHVLDRIVALKAILSGSLASAEEVRRFYQEARAAARLRHPNIVPIYGMGLHDGQHCFTMGLFPKGSLGKHLKAYQSDIRRSVELAVKVARAVQAAHERGIIHRDLKPGNILLDEQGEPVVSDFGLAKRLDVSATMTLPNQPIGTPAYMAPEQAHGDATTAASDIWALGVILYELLIGRRPFLGDGADEVKQRVLHADPLSPRRLRPDLPADLETIVLTCLAKEPARRYGSAAALADDLERWLRGDPIRARPESPWQRLHRQFRRRVGMKGVMLLLSGLLLMGAGAVGFWGIFSYFSPQAREQRRQEQVLASLRNELAQGRSVTLVPPLGPPRWYRWLTEKDRPPLPNLQKWPLKLNAVQGPLLVELLPDPQRSSYRFSAEVQFYGETEGQEIGIYFAHEELATPTGLEQCFALFRLRGEKNQKILAQLRLIGFYEQDVNEFTQRHEIIPSFKPPMNLFSNVVPPPAANSEPAPWRRIEVRVTPDEVRALCDGFPMGDYAIADVQRRIPRMWRATHPDTFPRPGFPPRGGLGLYVLGGPAYFRNVVVAPLPQP
jgi:serine/threonine protein kinase